uniref:Large ribosomal subunit protein mL50 n=1 Tax=Theropithecus gelada TaxID=9565 RepID=A0A8D2K3J8_THEGE
CAAQPVSGITRGVFMWTVSAATRRELWSRSRKEKVPEVAEAVEEVKEEPILVLHPHEGRLESYVKEVFGSSLPGNWQDICQEDGPLKFNLLVHLADDLGHVVSNSRLYRMCRVRNGLDLCNVPIQDRSKFDALRASNLPPPNLEITWSY